jgi:hypothetical protein
VALTSCNTNANPNCGLVAVEVYNTSTSAGPMGYRVGLVSVSGSTIPWGSPYYLGYDSGFNPSVSIQPCLTVSNTSCGVNVVEVNNSGGSAGTTLNIGGSYEYDSGWNPSVAATDFPGWAVAAHDGSGSAGPMWYHVGSILAIQ